MTLKANFQVKASGGIAIVSLDIVYVNFWWQRHRHKKGDAALVHTDLLGAIVCEGAAVVREAPAEAAALLRPQQEALSLQDHNLFFQTHYLTHRASGQLCTDRKKKRASASSGRHPPQTSEERTVWKNSV